MLTRSERTPRGNFWDGDTRIQLTAQGTCRSPLPSRDERRGTASRHEDIPAAASKRKAEKDHQYVCHPLPFPLYCQISTYILIDILLTKLPSRSSTLGSIHLSPQHPFNCEAYKISKAALNALTVEWASQLASSGTKRTAAGGIEIEGDGEKGKGDEWCVVAFSPGVSLLKLLCSGEDREVLINASAVVATNLPWRPTRRVPR